MKILKYSHHHDTTFQNCDLPVAEATRVRFGSPKEIWWWDQNAPFHGWTFPTFPNVSDISTAQSNLEDRLNYLPNEDWLFFFFSFLVFIHFTKISLILSYSSSFEFFFFPWRTLLGQKSTHSNIKLHSSKKSR